MPNEEERYYGATQELAARIKRGGYDGFLYPSAMGPSYNVVLFNGKDAEVVDLQYVRIKRVQYFADGLSEYEEPYEEGPYDALFGEK